MRKTLMTSCLTLSCAVFAYADFTHNLICRWTFNSKDAATALTDDVSGLKLSQTGTGKAQTLEFKDGCAVLGAGTLLFAPEINSDNPKFKSLGEQLTIWIRMKPEGKPQGFFAGLLDAHKPADWNQLIFTSHITDKGQLRLFGTNKEIKRFSTAAVPEKFKNQEFNNIVIQLNTKTKTYRMIVNGAATVEHKNNNAGDLMSFKSFALGRLKEHEGMDMNIDEVRLYSSYVAPEWLEEIEPVK